MKREKLWLCPWHGPLLVETTMCLSMIHEQQIGVNWKSLLLAINNSVQCVSTNTDVISFFPVSSVVSKPWAAGMGLLTVSVMWASALGRWCRGRDFLITSFHQEGLGTVFPSVRERAHLAVLLIFCTPASVKTIFLKSHLFCSVVSASPQVTR